ncbi:MAG: hypothetical protein ACI4SH_03100, partial [Candidatus Scatosoma sp.]
QSTANTLIKRGMRTIGDLAEADLLLMQRLLGKRGAILVKNARGEDDEPVRNGADEVKSVGNSVTLPADISDTEKIKAAFYALAESVASRLRAANVGKCTTVHITVKDEFFNEVTRQKKIPPTALCEDIARAAYELFVQEFPAGQKAHMLGVTVSGFDFYQEQLSLFSEQEQKDYEKRRRAEDAVAGIRKKYGYEKLQRGIVMQDNTLNGADIEHRKD